MDHISYSQYNTYTKCPRNWYLSKVKRAEEKQTWYLPIGTAVHQMVEDWLDPDVGPTLVTPSSAESYFYPLISAQLLIEPDTSKWMAGGPKADPITEHKALQRVKDCFEKALEYLDDIDVWEVEYDASGRLPGCEVEVKAFIDILGEHKKLGPVIVDWKSGANKPDSIFQLETYRALLIVDGDYRINGLHPNKGLWAMLAPEAKPKTLKAQTVDLSHVTPEEVGAKYQEVYLKMKAKLYPTQHSFDCNFCFNQDNCQLQAGPTERAKYYDRAHEDGFPF